MNVKQPDGWKGTSGSCIVSETHEHSITKPRLAEFSQPYKMFFGEIGLVSRWPCVYLILLFLAYFRNDTEHIGSAMVYEQSSVPVFTLNNLK